MSRSLDNISDIRKLMDECKQMGVKTLGPSVNESRHKFAVNTHGEIRFGMAAVKGVGEAAVQAIVEERERGGLYKDLFDFFERVNLAACNRKAIENLIIAGAFDDFKEACRETYFEPTGKQGEVYLDVLMRYGNKYQQDKHKSQCNLFGDQEEGFKSIHPALPKTVTTWGNLERLNKERELVGIYLSAHPLDEYSIILDYVCNTKLTQLDGNKEELSNMDEVTIGGIVSEVRTGETKNGNPYGIVKMEDFSGNGELALFGKDWIEYRNYFVEGTSLFIKIKVEPHRFRMGTFNVNIQSVDLLADVKDKLIEKITLSIPLDKLSTTLVNDLAEIVRENPGDAELVFRIHTGNRDNVTLMSRNTRIRVESTLVRYIKEHPEISITVNDNARMQVSA